MSRIITTTTQSFTGSASELRDALAAHIQGRIVEINTEIVRYDLGTPQSGIWHAKRLELRNLRQMLVDLEVIDAREEVITKT